MRQECWRQALSLQTQAQIKLLENAPCHNMRINENDLEAALYGVLSKNSQIIMNLDNLSNAGLLDMHLAEQADYGQRVEGLKVRKRALYEQLILCEIEKTEYMERKAGIDKELGRLEQVYSTLNTQTTQMRMDEDTKSANRKLAQEIASADGLTPELIDTLIEHVYVYPSNQLDIAWKIKDFCLDG